MSFYLLKGTYKRNDVGDVFFDLDQVESASIIENTYRDTENKVYILRIRTKGDNAYQAVFKTVEEAKVIAKEVLGNKITDEQLAEWQAEV